ncbi:MAG: beta-ketoacyl synthase N-terminal-like domain-containing protein, partial [Allorhizobium sp.]
MTDSRFKDHLGRPIIAVTGMGVITSLGQGLSDNWSKLTSGKSGIHYIKRFDTEGMSTRIGGTVDFIAVPANNAVERSYALARETTIEALAQAGINGDFNGPLFLAAPPVEPEWHDRFALAERAPASTQPGDAYDRFLAAMREKPDPVFLEAVQFGSISERLADKFGTRGLPVTLSTACASGATAIQLGVEAIRQGRTERALTVATDGSISPEAVIRFSLLSALSTQNDPPEKASKPFSKERDGFVIAEGAATLVLELHFERPAHFRRSATRARLQSPPVTSVTTLHSTSGVAGLPRWSLRRLRCRGQLVSPLLICPATPSTPSPAFLPPLRL